MELDNGKKERQFKTFFWQSLKRSCKGNYVNVDPFNTECLKHVEEYQKV